MGVSGAFKAAEVLARRIDETRSTTFRRMFVQVVGAGAMFELSQGFKDEKDPYDERWAPLKHRIGKILSDTGRLRGSFHLRLTPYGFVVETSVVYAGAHQDPHEREPVHVDARLAAHKARGGFMKNSAAARLIGRGKNVNVVLLPEHDIGPWKLDQRMMVPVPGKGVGRRWGEKMNTEADKVMRDHMGKP